jgi:hypothetical protein
MVPMDSIAASRALKIAAAVAVLALPRIAAPLDVGAFDEQQRQILERIHEIQANGGPYAPSLLAELETLIVLYGESGDHALAVLAIEQALQVVRANSGLYSLDQVPLLWQRIRSEEARGNDAEVWDLEQKLLTLVRRHPDDLRAATELRAMADRQMAVLDRVVENGETPPQVIYGCFYDEWPDYPGGSCQAGNRSTVVQGMLAEANRNHADAIAILLRNEAYSSDELRELELDLVRGAELIHSKYEERGVTGTRPVKVITVPLMPAGLGAELREPWRSRMASLVDLADWELPYDGMGTPEEEDFLQDREPREARFRSPYSRGRQSLRRLYAYGVAGSAASLTRASDLVRIADWDLFFSHNGLAVEGYALAHRLLEQAGAEAESVASLFAPPLPVVLPSFEPNPLARDESLPESGYIDVSFAITRYGEAEDIEIRGAANAHDSAVDDLVDLLKSSRFRPRFTNGQLADSVPVAVRYSLH